MIYDTQSTHISHRSETGIIYIESICEILCAINMCDLFLCNYECNIVNYADNTTLYACEPNMELVLSKL